MVQIQNVSDLLEKANYWFPRNFRAVYDRSIRLRDRITNHLFTIPASKKHHAEVKCVDIGTNQNEILLFEKYSDTFSLLALQQH